MQQIFNQMLELENEADSIIKKARQRSDEIMKEPAVKIAELREKLQKEFEEEKKNYDKLAREKMEKEVAQIKAETEKASAKVEKIRKDKMPAMVDKVVERFFKEHGN